MVVSKTANPVYGAPNSLTTFEINVTNSGDVLLNKTEITDLLPKGLTFINASPVVTSSTPNINGSTTLKWANLSQSFGRVLNPGEQFTIHVTASFNGNEYGKLTNTVTGKGYNLRYFADGDDDDQKVFDSSTSSDSIDVLALKQNIAVVKTLDIASGSPGTVVNFTLNIQNTGNISLKDVFVSDLLPDGMSYISSPPGSTNSGLHVNWSNIGPIEIGASKQLWVKALIRGPVVGNETLTNLVHVDGKPELGNNVTNSSTAIVQAQEAKIAVSKTADPTFGSPSTNVTFTLVVENSGQRPAAACLSPRSPARWHELCFVFTGQHPSGPECLLVRHRSHVLRCQQIVADCSPYRRPHFRHQKSDQLCGRVRQTGARPECHGQFLSDRAGSGSQDSRQQDRRSHLRLTEHQRHLHTGRRE